MNKLLYGIALSILFSASVFAEETALKNIIISPDEVVLSVGDELNFTAAGMDSAGNEIDVEVDWSVTGEVGVIDNGGEFKAITAGTGIVTAAVGDIKAESSVTVKEPDSINDDEKGDDSENGNDDAGDEVKGNKDGKDDNEEDVEDHGKGEKDGDDEDYEKVVSIFPTELKMSVGDTLHFSVTVIGGDSTAVDTSAVVWKVTKPGVGTIDETGLFTAVADGKTEVIVNAGKVYDEAEVKVGTGKDEDEDGDNGENNDEGIEDSDPVKIYPDDAEVAVGETVQFEVTVRDSAGLVIEDAIVIWSVGDPDIGSIDENGLFSAAASGETKIIATYGDVSAESEVEVKKERILERGKNTVKFEREFPGGKTTQFGSMVTENDTITVGGIPYPLNFLNGMKIYIPDGSLDENVKITFKLPQAGKLNNRKKEVMFDGDIISAVSFEVTVDSVVVSPYYFKTPLEITIPYKKGLLRKLGITPEDIGMYFVTPTGELLSEGITDIALDETRNLITGKVVHFSDIALAPRTSPTAVKEGGQPIGFSLLPNYPNPFNPITTLSFRMAEAAHVRLTIYNVLGQHVKTVVDEMRLPGTYSVTWDGTTDAGGKVTSGVYLYRLQADGFVQTRKLMLVK